MITREQALAAAAALAPRVQALEEMLRMQVALLPPGNGAWAATREQLEVHHGAYLALQNMANQAEDGR